MNKPYTWRGYCKDCGYSLDTHTREVLVELMTEPCPLCGKDAWDGKRINQKHKEEYE